ncbi:MAG TPA: AlkA N-terminal domain-containing protein [Nocardioidaceae bacterium]|nr:AlkA N-terminal domain-containing protein [Nocardioidaceae bacterium]
MDITDVEACYRAVKSRDRRFDGVFYIAVRTTGIYCRPSCPAQTPQLKNVTFHRTAAAAQGAGYRACKRCLPDATPGSPEWDVNADAAGRAMRLIADGLVEREGVEGLAQRLGYSSRHLTRLLTAEVGAGPLALARAKRAQTARTLIETSTMGFADVAFASGFASVRQFNDTIREVYAASPTDLRGRSRVQRTSPGRIELRLAVRAPFHAVELLEFLRLRLVRGVEVAGSGWYARSLRLPHGHGVARLDFGNLGGRGGTTEFVGCSLELADVRDLPSAVERCRRLIDADCDPVAVDEELGADRVLAPLVRRRPGLRVPGHVDGDEVAVRAVLGQQVTVKAAATAAARLTEEYGDPVETGLDGITHLFPTAAALAQADPGAMRMPRSRGSALTGLCLAIAEGRLALDRSGDRAEVRQALLALSGIGPWTADYVAMRALGDPDVFLPTDVGVKHALAGLGAVDPEAWRPWRSYALMHLWTSLSSSSRME